MRLIIDGNSYLNSALLRGVDHDEGRKVRDEAGKEHQVNGAQYGIENFFDKIVEILTSFRAAPRDMLVCWDGANAKARRRSFLPRYKEGRDKIPEVNEQLNKARDAVQQMLRDLGATNLVQPGMEADDVIAYLCKVLPGKKTVCTSDGDLTRLVDENTDVWRLGVLNENPYGPFEHRYITLYKALVGDSGDKIPGAPGFGDGAWVDLVRIFGLENLPELERMVVEGKLSELKENVADFPKLQKIIDGADSVATSWLVASLHVDDVNTMRRPLEITAGMVKPYDALPDDRRVEELRHFYGTKTLVSEGNLERVKKQMAEHLAATPFFALDIETSDGEESEEWLESVRSKLGKDVDRLDVLGHELTGMSITFGQNTQHTIYMTVDHVETDKIKNITVDQCREVCEMLPPQKLVAIQNRNFEFSVLYRTWGEKWKDNGWAGFVPNAIDTKIGSSYVNENLPKGLKENSQRYLDYKQATYADVTQKRGTVGTLKGGVIKEIYDHVLVPAVTEPNPKSTEARKLKDKIIVPAVTEKWELREYKMNQLTAGEVFDYGCDDTICTSALHTFYQLVMEIEGTWGVYMEVEQLPEYVTSLAYVQGVKVDGKRLVELEKADDEAYDREWAKLSDFLIARGWEGTVCPEFEGDIEPSDVKMAIGILCPNADFASKKRKLDAIAFDMREQLEGEPLGELLAKVVEQNDVRTLNKLVRDNFTGQPAIKFNSPKQMQNLFYRVMGLTPRIFNALTDNQRQDPVFSSAFKKKRKEKEGKPVEYTPEEQEALLTKASTDDDVVEVALVKDTLSDEIRSILKSYQKVRSVMTRRSLFYKTYRAMPHWRDDRVHSSMNQCEAVTRRYSSSGPNLQQLPKLGDGKEFRQVIVPHHKDAVIVSCDFSGQELRLMAHLSGDVNLTSCYVGDNKKDVHSLTAAAASEYLWDGALSYASFVLRLKSDDKAVADKAAELRKDSKVVNFGTNYDMAADSLSAKLRVEPEIAQKFIDAKDAAMPGIGIWKDAVRAKVEEIGYASTLMGARRHLRDVLMGDDQWERSKAGRQGPNFEIQSSGAEQSKLAMGTMWLKKLFTGKYDARFIAPIHDECVASVHKDQAIDFIREFHAAMAQPYGGMTIPVVSSISIGRNFGEQIECGEDFDPVAIQKALDEIFAKEEVAA